MPLYNIARTSDGHIMLGCDVETKGEAEHYLRYYRDTYGPGKMYPNGEGYYDSQFALAILNGDDYELVN